jgi:hypothetical protein
MIIQTLSNDNDNYECVDLEGETIGGHFHPNVAGSEDPLDMSSQISRGNVFNPIDLSQLDKGNSQTASRTTVNNLYTTLTKNADTYPILHAYLLAGLKHIHGKQMELIARGDAMLQLISSPSYFLARGGDNSLKRHRSFLENPPSKKKNITYVDFVM